MKVKVTSLDIADGRQNASSACGCPINLALSRTLGVDEIILPNVKIATLGNLRMKLPRNAINFQRKLMDNPDAEVKPFEFETDIFIPRRRISRRRNPHRRMEGR